MDETIEELTNSFHSIQEGSPISIQNEKSTSSYSLRGFNLKKIGIFGGILFILSLLIVIFFLDTKYYKKENKIQYHYILLDTLCVMIFLVLFYFSVKWIQKLFYKF